MSSNEVDDLEQLKAKIGRLVHGDYHAVHGWDTPLVNNLVDIFNQEAERRTATVLERLKSWLDDAPYIEHEGGFFLQWEDVEGHIDA